MLGKVIIVGLLLAIIWSLLSAFYFMVRDQGQGERTVWRLTWRVGLSLVLFLFLYLAYQMGWITPSSSGPIGLKPPAEAQSGKAEPAESANPDPDAN